MNRIKNHENKSEIVLKTLAMGYNRRHSLQKMILGKQKIECRLILTFYITLTLEHSTLLGSVSLNSIWVNQNMNCRTSISLGSSKWPQMGWNRMGCITPAF